MPWCRKISYSKQLDENQLYLQLTPTPTKKELVISWETKIGKQNKKTAVS